METEFDVDVDIEFGEEKGDKQEGDSTKRGDDNDSPVAHDPETESFGYAGQPIIYLDSDVALYACANSIRFFSPDSGTKNHIWGAGQGVGAIAVHRGSERLVYAERGLNPNIYMVNYAKFTKIRTFSNGTQLEYADLAFSRDGRYLASLGGLPDFNLVIWDTSSMSPLVQVTSPSCKYVSFNPRNSMELCTSGGPDGNLVFWTMEKNYNQYSLSMVQVKRPKIAAEVKYNNTAAADHPQIDHQEDDKSLGFMVKLFSQEAQQQGVYAEFGPHCWNTKGEVYCGVSTGILQLFDIASGEVMHSIKVVECPINVVALSQSFVITAAKSGNISWISTSENTIVFTINLVNYDIRTMAITADYNRMLIGTQMGTMHVLPYVEPGSKAIMYKPKKVADFHVSTITGMASLAHAHQMVTCSLDGTLRLWNYMEKPFGLISKVVHGTALTALSAARTNVIAVGSELGVVRVFEISLTDERKAPSLIHRARIHKSAVHKIAYHPQGVLIATAGKEDGLICIIDSTTTSFPVLGYVSILGRVMDMVWYCADGINHLFVATDAGYLFRLTPPALPAITLEFDNKDVQKSLLKISPAANSIVVDPRTSGVKKQNIYCTTVDKRIKRYTMPERTGDPDLIESLDITPPKEEHRAHDKPGRSITISPNEMWLASGGGDGTVSIRSLEFMRKVMILKGHDAYMGGIDFFTFSHDSLYMITASSGDGTILCRSTKDVEELPVIKSAANTRSLFQPGETTPIALQNDHDDKDELTVFEAFTFEEKRATEKQFATMRQDYANALAQIKEEYHQILSINSMAPEMEKLTDEDMVIDLKERDRLVAEGDAQVRELKEQIRYENIARDLLTHRLKTEFYDSMVEHAIEVKPFKGKFLVANYPIRKQTPDELQQLEQVKILRRIELREFRIRKLEAELLQLRIQKPTETPTASRTSSAHQPRSPSPRGPPPPFPPTSSIPSSSPAPAPPAAAAAAKSDAAGKEPAQIGTAMPKFGQLTIKGSMRELDMAPPPPQLTAQLAQENAKADKKRGGGSAQGMRTTSTLRLSQQAQMHQLQLQRIDILDDEEFDPDDIPDDWPSLVYHPIDVHTPHRKVTQIHVLGQLIYVTKQKFNAEVKTFLDSKKVEIGKIEERNERIQEIGAELGERIELFQPSLAPSELPDSVLHVSDSQITAAKYIAEERAHTAGGPNGPDSYDRALRVMMGGGLDAKAAQPLEEELVRPEWMAKKEEEMSEEELKELRAFEKKVEGIREEKEKARKALETELKKLQTQISDICTAFDDKLKRLESQRLATDQQIYEMELQQIKLAQALLDEEDAEKREAELEDQLDILIQKKNKSTSILTELKADIDKQREEHDQLVAHDKGLEKAFRRDFYEKDTEDFYDYLLKTFKRRPKPAIAASLQAPTRNAYGGDPFESDSLARSPSLSEEIVLEKPDGLDPETWELVLEARNAKIANEVEIKRKAASLNELLRYYDDLQDRDEALKTQLDVVLKERQDFALKRMWDASNLELLLKLKQGQVEVEQAPFVTDYSDCVFINQMVIEDYNTNIKTQAKDKVALLKEMKNTKKLIRKKKWENLGLDMQSEDLMEKTKQFQLLRVTKQLQTFIKGGGEDQHALENATLEKRAEHGQRSHEQKLQEMKKQLGKILKLTQEKEAENERMDAQLAEQESSTHERQKIYGVQVARRLGPQETDSRLSRLLRGRKLADKVKTQEDHLKMLNTEVDKLRKRTFPTFGV